MINKPIVAVVTTAWGSRHGGINSFSTALCRALAQVLSEDSVWCICFRASESDHRDAEASNVRLLPLEPQDNDPGFKKWAIEATNQIRKQSAAHISWWIGHDAITGHAAEAGASSSSNSKWAIIMHMSYEDYSYLKHPPERAPEIAEKINTQQLLLRAADVAFAVGPLLLQRLQSIRDNSQPIVMLVPGLADQAPPVQSTERVNAITFGRFESEEILIKQGPLAVAGFARAVAVGHETQNSVLIDSNLHIVGVPSELVHDLRRLSHDEAGRVVNVKAHDFIENPYELQRLLHKSNVCLMLSWHEGFGLSGWEAIGAGIPVIVSRNTGLYRLLDKLGGAASGCVVDVDIKAHFDPSPNGDDVDTVKNAILRISSDLSKAIANAKSLRNLLRFQHYFTWENTAREVAQALDLKTEFTMLDAQVPRTERETAEVGGINTAGAVRLIGIAENFCENGKYRDALSTLEDLKGNFGANVPPSVALDATIIESTVLLRINEYQKALLFINRAARESAERRDWRRYIRARSVEIYVLLDLGKYDQAKILADDLLTVAEREDNFASEGIKRKLARALALSGHWDLGVKHATEALGLAKTRNDVDAIGKAAFAIGEANRLGLNQHEAIDGYEIARDSAARTGNVDCYLWATIGLADSLFLLKNFDEAEKILMEISAFVQKPEHNHPLESLHIEISLLAIQEARKSPPTIESETLVARYDGLGISWARHYVEAIKSGDFSNPKKF
jgi:glycosyltransferase involved in cell wall biosynthesis